MAGVWGILRRLRGGSRLARISVHALIHNGAFGIGLFLTLSGCSAGGGGEREGSGGDGSKSGSGNGTTTGGGPGDPPIVTLEPQDVPNPCEQDGAPEECELVAPPACG